MDPNLLHDIGLALGEIAGFMFAMKLVGSVKGILFGVKAGIGAASGAAATAAESGGFAKFLKFLGSGTAAAEGTLIGALVVAGKELSKVHDYMRGGNGIISQEATAFEELAIALHESGIETGLRGWQN